ncbi:hypothetical protein Acsp04_51790 [Actinomadura sp. NBRC 104425]|uniref:hypothetical protein n=1 Tax=Actinomadura sp. NBRC 104425 TaxID=3032204 RepID=UPI0024A5DF06|nr:hypothetical protein [Actinomadura sp. NBRC 104425]GLZ14944.1 hypothetical protein Acsp04_51790 [Actinomadura sp. NBRC 104425]
MSLSYLPDSAHPRVAVDPTVPAEDRRALREHQDVLTPASSPVPGRLQVLIGGSVVRLIRRYHGRYIVAADLDPDAKILLCRAQEAIDTVLQSEVNRAGLLDGMDNALTLPAEEWEIAQTLMTHSRMREEQRRLRESDLTPLEKSRFAPQREALRRSVAAVTERIEALEEYAAHTAAADDAYRRQRRRAMPPPDHSAQILELERRNEAYEELLARTAAHELAAERIEELAEDAAEVESALRRAGDAARRVGGPSAP